MADKGKVEGKGTGEANIPGFLEHVKKEKTQFKCVIFFELNDQGRGGDNSVCCTFAGWKMAGCWKNDEARSMIVMGPAGTVLTVYDNPDAVADDDYFWVQKLDDYPVSVGSFDHPAGRVFGQANYVYSGGNGLDGKVSTFRWSLPL